MILLFEEYQYEKADDIALIKKCVAEAYLIESKRSPLEGVFKNLCQALLLAESPTLGFLPAKIRFYLRCLL